MPRINRQYLVIGCTNCGRLLLATSERKTRTCPYCGKRVKSEEARIFAHSDNAKVARQALQEAKTKLLGTVSTAKQTGR